MAPRLATAGFGEAKVREAARNSGKEEAADGDPRVSATKPLFVDLTYRREKVRPRTGWMPALVMEQQCEGE